MSDAGRLAVEFNGASIPFAIELVEAGSPIYVRYRLVSRPLWTPVDEMVFETAADLQTYYESRKEYGSNLIWMIF